MLDDYIAASSGLTLTVYIRTLQVKHLWFQFQKDNRYVLGKLHVVIDLMLYAEYLLSVL